MKPNNPLFLSLPVVAVLLTVACNPKSDSIESLPSRYITLDDSLQLHYKQWGEGSQTILFVQGSDHDMNAWEAQYDALRDDPNLRLLFVDLPGAGKSDRPKTAYSLDLCSQALYSVLDEVKSDFTYLVADSFGASVCQQMSAINRWRVAGMLEATPAQDNAYPDFTRDLQNLISTVIANNMESYEFGIKQLEENYAGFEYKVTDANRAAYEQIKQEYHDSIARGAMFGPIGVAELCCYMQDYHLGCSFRMWSDRFPMHWATYTQDMKQYAPQPVARQLDDQTFLLRFPSCSGDEAYVKWVWDAVAQYRQSGCTHLIVDIRGNGGGSDYQYYPICQLLYLQPGGSHGAMMRNSADNREQWRQAAPEVEWVQTAMDYAEAHPDEKYIAISNEYLVKEEKSVDPRRPQKAAIIIDHCVASSGEQLLIDLRSVASDVKRYGRDNSLGCIDISNCIDQTLPHTDITMRVPTSISRRVILGEQLIDGIGIEPDVRLDLPLPEVLTDNVDDWVLYVANELKK